MEKTLVEIFQFLFHSPMCLATNTYKNSLDLLNYFYSYMLKIYLYIFFSKLNTITEGKSI